MKFSFGFLQCLSVEAFKVNYCMLHIKLTFRKIAYFAETLSRFRDVFMYSKSSHWKISSD